MYLRFSLLICYCFLSISLSAQHNIKVDKVADGFTIPVDITHAGDERLFVVGKRGVIMGFERNDPTSKFEFLNITARVNSSANEKGLLGLTFDPDYKNNGYFYVNYSDQFRNSVVSRFNVMPNDPNVADPTSEKMILSIPQPFTNHNGGCLKFGPDGYLYIGWGDGGNANDPGNRSQNVGILLGKMLRIDVHTDQPYLIPPTNPFIDSSEVRDEIWAIGLRNPWRYSFDKLTGDLWIGDVGQNTWEEIDFQAADSKGGENYGWRCYEAEQEFNTNGCSSSGNYDFPIYFYRNQRSGLGCSVTGGFVYRGKEIPSLYGHYIYSDFCSGRIWVLIKDSSGVVNNEEIYKFSGNQISTFGEDIDGELYFAALQTGDIYKISSNCDLDISLEIDHESCPNQNDGMAKIIFNQPAPNNVQIEWSNGETGEIIKDLADGQYSVTVKSSLCEVTETFEIESSKLPNPCLNVTDENIILCNIDTFILNSCVAPNGYTYRWFQDGNPLLLGSDTINNLIVTETGAYRVSWQSNDCDLGLSEPAFIVLLDQPMQSSIDFMNDTLWATEGFGIYEWYLNDSLLKTTSEHYILIDKSGIYSVRVGSNEDCLSELSEQLHVIKTSTFLLNDSSNKLTIYPNPVSNYATIMLDKNFTNSDITIFDVNGRIVYHQYDNNFKTLNIDVSKWAEAVYFVEIASGFSQIGGRLVVIR